MPAARKLTPRQEAFVREYLIDLNGKAAAIRAGYAPKQAVVQGVRLVKVCKPYIDAELAKRAKKATLTADRVLEEISRVGLCDAAELFDEDGRLLPLREMPESVRRVVASIEVEEDWKGDEFICTRIKKVKLWDKVRALDLAQRHLGVVQKHELTGKDGGPLEIKAELAPLPKETLEQIWCLLNNAISVDAS